MAYGIGFISGRIVFLIILAFAIMTLIKTRSVWNDGKMWKSFGIITALLLLIQVGTTSIHFIQLIVVSAMLITTVVFNIKSEKINKIR